MDLAIALGLGLLLTAYALYRRRQRRLSVNFDAFTKVLSISFGISVAVAFVVVPSGQLAILFVLHRAQLTPSDLASVDVRSILVSAVIGALVTAAWSVQEYIERIHRP